MVTANADEHTAPKNDTISVVVKVTNNCNMSCKYCFADSGKHDSESNISEETLKNIISKLQSNYKNITYTWHGGEPLIVGKELYETILDMEEKHKNPDQLIRNKIQTNGTLLDQDWIDFLKENDIGIKLSLDGPQNINDLTRIYTDGRGTFKQIKKSIDLLKENNIEPKAVCVTNKNNIDKLESIYEYFKTEGIIFLETPIFISGRATKDSTNLYISPEEYGEAMIKLFDKWFYEKEPIKSQYFEEIIHQLLSDKQYKPGGCMVNSIAIDEKGDVYPCNMFFGNEEMIYGNINNDSIEYIMKDNPVREKMINRKVDDCVDCEYKTKCAGGCAYGAYNEHGDINKKDNLCEANKMVYRHIEKALIEEFEKAKTRNSI